MGSGLTKCCGVCTTPIVGIAKQRHGAFQELRRRHEIGVEDRDEFRRIGQRGDMRKRVVDVAGLGVRIVRPREVAAAELVAERLHPGAAAVVEHPDAKIRIVHAERADDRALEDFLLLVVRADEHVDRRRLLERREPSGIRVRVGRPIARPGEKQERQRGGCDPDKLGDEKDDGDRIFEADPPAPASSSVIRHHAYWVIMAKLPATMTTRPIATGLGQIAAQTKKTPIVASAG